MEYGQVIQVHPVRLPQPEKLLVIEPLDYDNPYDFHRPHRHDYFELILIKNGSGSQIIDCNTYEMQGGQLFTIYPGQVHLMDRNSAQGLIIQFHKDIFRHIQPLNHYHLYFSNPVFSLNNDDFLRLYTIAEYMMEVLEEKEASFLTLHKAYSYLQIILISISESYYGRNMKFEGHIVKQFLSLLPKHIRSRKKVNDYCSILGCSQDKLNEACKASLGKTALKLIHEELLLEIRRMFLLNELSIKEIAFELNFDSPANFSGFIKSQTGYTPSEMQASILGIYG